ncbi:MAG: energy-coupling factor transporter ATPase, partial [Clostridia bacterium]|nr:energy-coupling factor transporter ATPase [Clostridia bacterium]
MEPRLLVLDEPMAGLDPVGREEIIDCIRSYRETTGASILFVTHSMEDAARIADRLIVLNQGEILMEGTPEAVFSRSEELVAADLGVPTITRLFMELRARGIELSDSVYTVDYALKQILRAKEGK